MNSFTIFYLLALCSISFAPAQAERRVRCEIKEARVHNVYLRTCKKFDNGDVYLYEVGTSYQIGDNSGEFSREFEIKRYNTVVTEDRITVQYFSWAIWIFTSDGNNIAFYQDLFSLEDFDHEFPVARVVRGGRTMKNVLAVNAKEDEDGHWIFAAMDSSGPRLIFPSRNVQWTQQYEDFDKSVSFIVEYEPRGKKITVVFDHSGVAKTFYLYVKSRCRPLILC